MAYDTTEAVAKFLSGFQMKITNRERDTVAPDYYVKYSLTLSKGSKGISACRGNDGIVVNLCLCHAGHPLPSECPQDGRAHGRDGSVPWSAGTPAQ